MSQGGVRTTELLSLLYKRRESRETAVFKIWRGLPLQGGHAILGRFYELIDFFCIDSVLTSIMTFTVCCQRQCRLSITGISTDTFAVLSLVICNLYGPGGTVSLSKYWLIYFLCFPLYLSVHFLPCLSPLFGIWVVVSTNTTV
jgi:hypothetical protein